ncbi:MAG: gamma carbonic anhydrase family protein [Candidatus Competibacteraceae bacterium]|nr:gamma carbonic anhydrase family protein [Candidatus Competibacteraceae bacterium]MCB1806650.1 gamma carbonic anhydrase family protein [Candidatus Competibacteraceae bacterium]MCB1815409.1 gamma carbonic anhydrase family protein [Candidatus Competibacteraceae bacterium]
MIYALGERQVQCESDDWFVADSATVIGSVILKNNASVWFNAVVRGDNDLITIGADTNIQDGSVLHADPGIPLTFGRGVTVGHMAMLHGCTVGDNTLIGIKAVVLNHAVIGKNCIIGANSLVTEGKVIPDNSLLMGAPAKVIRTVTDEEVQNLRLMAEHYVQNFKRYKAGLKPMPPLRLPA